MAPGDLFKNLPVPGGRQSPEFDMEKYDVGTI
jgi:hypothetical protein